MSALPQIDMWDGWFDWIDRGIRIQFINGRPGMRCGKNCCGLESEIFEAMQPGWGSNPDLPAHLVDEFYRLEVSQ